EDHRGRRLALPETRPRGYDAPVTEEIEQMPRPRVLVTEPIHAVGVERLAREADVVNLPDRPGETIDQHLPEVDGVVVRTARLTAERLQAAVRLKVIGKHGVGVDNVDVAAASAR